MKNKLKRQKLLISYCGIVCSLCPLYRGKYKEKKCFGCKILDECNIVKCAKKKKIKYCFYCAQFPCRLYRKGFQWDIEGEPVIWKPYSPEYVKMFGIAKKLKKNPKRNK